jgi:hypothetical protein
MERRGVITLKKYTRTEKFLDDAIRLFEELAVSSALASSRKLESMMGKLRSIRRIMQRIDKTDPSSRARFWKLSRRAVLVATKLSRLLSSS